MPALEAIPTTREDIPDIESQSVHERHLYEGFPNYWYEEDRTTSGALSEKTQSNRSHLSGLRHGISQFEHPLGKETTSSNVIVDFQGLDDPYRPMNWPFQKKVYTTLLYGLTTLGSTWGSSIFGTGPLLWAPLSEVFGRKPAVLYPYFIGAIFAFGTASAKDVQTLMLTRFFGGFFASAPVTNTGGVLGDLWTPAERGAALAGYSFAVAGGPLLAPVVGGAIADSSISWRWDLYITGILMLLILGLDLAFIDESYAPTLLVYKARRLRHETGNWALHAKHEEWDITFTQLAHKYLVRPFQLLVTPITACMAVYSSFVYGILYLSFASFPIEFEEERGWNHLVGSLPFIAVLLGTTLGALGNSLNTGYYMSRVKANNNRPVPEARLPPMMVGAVLFPVGCFLFGWTSSRHIFWIGPVIGAFLIGLGFITIFQCALNYLIDTFQLYAASAVAGNTALRSMFAGVFPIFAPAMFHNMGINWASSVIGFVGIAMIPIPFIFFVYGKRIRARGKWSRPSTES